MNIFYHDHCQTDHLPRTIKKTIGRWPQGNKLLSAINYSRPWEHRPRRGMPAFLFRKAIKKSASHIHAKRFFIPSATCTARFL